MFFFCLPAFGIFEHEDPCHGNFFQGRLLIIVDHTTKKISLLFSFVKKISTGLKKILCAEYAYISFCHQAIDAFVS
jgi:hypothetical protein